MTMKINYTRLFWIALISLAFLLLLVAETGLVPNKYAFSLLFIITIVLFVLKKRSTKSLVDHTFEKEEKK